MFLRAHDILDDYLEKKLPGEESAEAQWPLYSLHLYNLTPRQQRTL